MGPRRSGRGGWAVCSGFGSRRAGQRRAGYHGPMSGPLSSLDNPRLKAVLRLRKARERRRTRRLVAEGWREVVRALAAGLVPREVFYSPQVAELAPGYRGMIERLRQEAGAAGLKQIGPDGLDEWETTGRMMRVQEVTAAVLRKAAYREQPEGILGVFDQPRWRWRAVPTGERVLLLVAVGLAKPGNLGAMARTSEAAGAAALVVADAVVDPFNPNAVRASTGAVFSLPVLGARGERVRRWLRQRGVAAVSADPLADGPHYAADLTGPVAVVIGPEHEGLAEDWRTAGQAVRIPMQGELTDSLNASVAAGILLFEAVRQRAERLPSGA